MSVRVTGLVHRWPGFELHVDRFEVADRAVVTGPSGSGKSTLLAILAGEVTPSVGSVEVAGHDLAQMDAAARRRLRLASIGMVLQDSPLVEHLDATQNVLLPWSLGLPPDPHAQERARHLLSELGLERHLRSRPASMSAGERQRVAIARALVTRPTLVLADEPTSGLDPQRTSQVVDLLLRYVDATLVVVTHDPAVRARFDHHLDLGR